MMSTQTISPNPHIPCKPGWCLAYVNEAFGVPKRYGSATAAWQASATKHTDRNFPAGVWVPVWYGIDVEPLGHVVLLAPDGSCYSTSDLSNTPHHHPNLAHLESYYAYYGMKLSYRGWTEDVEGTPVITTTTITPQGSTQGDDDMPITDEDAVKIARVLLNYDLGRQGEGQSGTVNLGAVLAWYDANNAAVTQNTVNGILNGPIPWYGFDGNHPTEGRTETTLALATGWNDALFTAVLGQVAGLKEIISQLAVKQGVTIDYKAIAKAVNDDAAARMVK